MWRGGEELGRNLGQVRNTSPLAACPIIVRGRTERGNQNDESEGLRKGELKKN